MPVSHSFHSQVPQEGIVWKSERRCKRNGGRTAGITKPDGSTEAYLYEYAGNMTSSTDGEGNTTLYAYDLAGNMVSITDPAGETEVVDNKRLQFHKEYIQDSEECTVMRKNYAYGTMVFTDDRKTY